jgi:hypothetical protein
VGKYGSPDLEITVASKDMHPFLLDFGGLDIEAITEEGHTFGDDWVKHLFTGLKQGNDISMTLLYDDDADGPDDVLNNVGDEVAVAITWGGANISSFDAIIKNYSRNPARGEMTKANCTLVPTGEITEAP